MGNCWKCGKVARLTCVEFIGWLCSECRASPVSEPSGKENDDG
jgi:hypothetical protein